MPVSILQACRDRGIIISQIFGQTETSKITWLPTKISSVAVIGVHNPKWGKTGKAFVVQKEVADLTEEEAVRFCAGRVAKFKIPKYVKFIDRIPENAAGKIMRHLLKDIQ